MNVLFISNLFPDTTEPYRGFDNSVVLHHLARSCEIRVISPRPTLPFRNQPRAPQTEDRSFHPVFPPVLYVPKIGSRINHWLFAKSIEAIVRSLRRDFRFDVILCSWAYPDVCAVAMLASRMQVPFVAIVQGTDVHSYLTMPIRKNLIVSALNEAGAVITRSRDLARRLEAAGVAKNRLHTILNGVDQAIFTPGDQTAARRELGLPPDASIALFVGNFYPIKDPILALSAHTSWAKSAPTGSSRLLVFVGGGPMEGAARNAAHATGAGHLVVFAGRQTPSGVARYMQAADCLLLTSHNEGLPNVILEAISCGLPVVATNVGGVAEVLSHPGRGRLVDTRAPDAIAAAVEEVTTLATRHASGFPEVPPFHWPDTAEKYLALVQSVVPSLTPNSKPRT